MVLITRVLPILSVVAVALALSLKRDAATIEADVANIASEVTTLDDAIEAFPFTGGTLLAALVFISRVIVVDISSEEDLQNIHSDAVTLINTLDQTIADIEASEPLSETDCETILAAVEAIEPIIFDALNDIIAKKPAFAALPIGGLTTLILQDLENLETATIDFANALMDICPADLEPEETELSQNITAAFVPAIVAYSS
ncbi:Hydrophobic surface binding protein [Mycena sanguinolenta]|uniref:Hydrophobic surface binding protein n=1 Tax=Mycena sanguinolenta TaxID=230812 RepID=A0A8H6XU37_9AGAR|nr:Hydrophobic surface binding protein [Mycena sanguinolenta]